MESEFIEGDPLFRGCQSDGPMAWTIWKAKISNFSGTARYTVKFQKSHSERMPGFLIWEKSVPVPL
jgi:hypothetical protein